MLRALTIPVHLGNHNAGVVGVLLSQLVPDGSQLLAMSAPWGVELDEHVALGIVDHLVEVLANRNFEGTWSREGEKGY